MLVPFQGISTLIVFASLLASSLQFPAPQRSQRPPSSRRTSSPAPRPKSTTPVPPPPSTTSPAPTTTPAPAPPTPSSPTPQLLPLNSAAGISPLTFPLPLSGQAFPFSLNSFSFVQPLNSQLPLPLKPQQGDSPLISSVSVPLNSHFPLPLNAQLLPLGFPASSQPSTHLSSIASSSSQIPRSLFSAPETLTSDSLSKHFGFQLPAASGLSSLAPGATSFRILDSSLRRTPGFGNFATQIQVLDSNSGLEELLGQPINKAPAFEVLETKGGIEELLKLVGPATSVSGANPALSDLFGLGGSKLLGVRALSAGPARIEVIDPSKGLPTLEPLRPLVLDSVAHVTGPTESRSFFATDGATVPQSRPKQRR